MSSLLSLMEVLKAADPPAGVFSPAAWVVISALGTALMGVSLFGAKWATKIYDDLKECNKARVASEEEVLGLLKVLRVSMEQSKGGKQR
jgi:hypothetical protein